MKKQYFFALILWACLINVSAQTPLYNWKNVAIGGGGYCLDIKTHPIDATALFASCDVSGLFKWDYSAQTWRNLNNVFNVDNSGLYGCDGFALHPTNANIIYAYFGKYTCETNSGIFKSTDSGNTWTLLKNVRGGANQNFRYVQNPLVIDPRNPNRIYCGTRTEGLQITNDAGITWQTATTVPLGNTGDPINCYWLDNAIGIRSVIIDPNTSIGTNSANIYAAIYGTGIYKSTNGGVSFALMPGSPTLINRIAISGSTIVATAQDGVFKFNGSTWASIIPPNQNYFAFNAVAIDPTNPNKIVIGTGYSDLYQQTHRSTDGGNTWTNISVFNGLSSPVYTVDWFPTNHYLFQASTSTITFDAQNPNVAYMGDWFSVWKTNNIWASPVVWQQQNKGYESIVNLVMTCPPSGASLFSGHADVIGFRHSSVDNYPTKKFVADAAECTGIDYQENNPNNMAMVVSNDWYGLKTRLLTSVDNGISFVLKNLPDTSINGKIAINTANANNLVYLSANKAPFYSNNGGNTWAASTGVPSGIINTNYIFQYHQPLISDKVNANTFYIYSIYEGKLKKSTNGGVSFVNTNATALPIINTNIQSDFCNLNKSFMPFNQNHFCISLGSQGLWQSFDDGLTFTKNTFFDIARMSAMGKPIGTNLNTTLYVYGKRLGAWGVFKSTDNGGSWVQINDARSQMGNEPTAIAADRQTEGQVYIGTNGSGIWYGNAAAPLSIDVLNFGAECKNNQPNLHWNLIAKDEAYIINLQHSPENQTWKNIKTQQIDANINQSFDYKHEINDLNTHYYRLEMVDNSGKKTYSKVLANRCGKSAFDINIYPNPAKNTLSIAISPDDLGNHDTNIVLMDVFGKVITTKNNLTENTVLDINNLPQGIYFIKITLGDTFVVQKVVKE